MINRNAVAEELKEVNPARLNCGSVRPVLKSKDYTKCGKSARRNEYQDQLIKKMLFNHLKILLKKSETDAG